VRLSVKRSGPFAGSTRHGSSVRQEHLGVAAAEEDGKEEEEEQEEETRRDMMTKGFEGTGKDDSNSNK
jgi:hypothetical protein